MSALYYATGSTNVDFGSAPMLDTVPIGTINMWVYVYSVANALGGISNKGVSGTPKLNIFRRGNPGNQFRCSIQRATAAQIVDLNGVKAGLLQFLSWSWNITSGGPKAYLGSLNDTVVDASANVANGSGAQTSDNSDNLRIGAVSGATDCMEMKVLYFSYYNRQLAQIDIEQLRLNSDLILSNILLHCYPGRDGQSKVIDYSGNNNHGTINGAVPVSDIVLR